MASRSRKLTGSAGALLGYFEELRLRGLEAYYSPTSNGDGGGDEVVFDELWGKAAERLGIEQLTRSEFYDLVNGQWRGDKLVGAGYRKVVDKETGEERTERARTTMIDVVWAAPKSVAELLVATDSEELRTAVISAFKESIKIGFNSMEEHAAVARVPVETPLERGRATVQHGPRAGQESKMQGSRTQRVPAELLALPIVQFSARPTDETIARGSPPDPHPHLHTPIFAVSWVPDDVDSATARTYTPDEAGIRRQAGEREAVWMGEFARRLEDLGIPIDYSVNAKGAITWEIAGSNPAVRRFFSTNGERAHVIRREFEAAHGRSPTNGEVTAILDVTRRRKDADHKQVDQLGAWERWREAAENAGHILSVPSLAAGGVRRHRQRDREDELRTRLFAGTGLARDDSVFTRDIVRATVARCATGLGFSPAALAVTEREIDDEILPVFRARDPRFDLFTTHAVVAAELSIAAVIERKAHDVLPCPTDAAVSKAIRNSPVPLDAEQRAAVELMCSPQAWVIIEGHAGTGKTATLAAVVEAYRETYRGRPTATEVIVLSTAAATAERTGRPLDANQSRSIDAYVTALKFGARRPDERTLIIVDEAAMVDTPRMAALLEAAGDACIRGVGDPAQLTPIGPAGWYGEATGRHRPHELQRVYRQTDAADARDYRLVREGAAAQALASLDERGRVHVAEDRSHAVQLAVEMYRDQLAAGEITPDLVIVLDGSNHEVDTVNRLVQQELRRRADITGPGYDLRATDTQRRWSLHDEDRVIFLTSYDRDAEKPFVRGEQRQRRVHNGETGVIVAIDIERNVAVVSMDRGDIVAVALEEEARTQALGLAYAVHIAKYQGDQARIAFVLPSTSPIATQNSGYGQLTRGQVEAHIIVDYETHGDKPLERLARAWSRRDSKRTAVSYLDSSIVDEIRADVERRAAERRAERDAAATNAAASAAGRQEPVSPAARRETPRPPSSPEEALAYQPSPRPDLELEAEELLVDTIDLYDAAAKAARAAGVADPTAVAQAEIEAALARSRAEQREAAQGRDDIAEPTLDPENVWHSVTAAEKNPVERDVLGPDGRRAARKTREPPRPTRGRTKEAAQGRDDDAAARQRERRAERERRRQQEIALDPYRDSGRRGP